MPKPKLFPFEVRNRWTGAVQFTASISLDETQPLGLRVGAAVRWAVESGAVLRGADLRGADLRDAVLSDAVLSGADLSGADLSGADLRGADLRGADLRGADLRGADLRGADLRHIKADFWLILTMASREVPSLIAALRNGNVNGSTYEGACACLVGSLENAGAAGLPHVPNSPAEAWFAPIRPGDKPGDESEGGFRAQSALDWALEWCERSGVDPEPAQPAEAA